MMWGIGAAIVAIVLAALSGFRLGYLEASDEYDRQISAAKERVDEANYRAALAAFRYEEWKARQETVVVVKEVKRAVAAPAARAWASTQLPDGVRDAAKRAVTVLGASKPASAVP